MAFSCARIRSSTLVVTTSGCTEARAISIPKKRSTIPKIGSGSCPPARPPPRPGPARRATTRAGVGREPVAHVVLGAFAGDPRALAAGVDDQEIGALRPRAVAQALER